VKKHEILFEKIMKAQRGVLRGVVQVIEYMYSKWESLSSNPCRKTKQKILSWKILGVKRDRITWPFCFPA
jgi:hypothetical protein